MSGSVSIKYSSVGAGLDAWVQFAKSIRIAGRGGASYPPFGQQSSAFASYYTVFDAFNYRGLGLLLQ